MSEPINTVAKRDQFVGFLTVKGQFPSKEFVERSTWTPGTTHPIPCREYASFTRLINSAVATVRMVSRTTISIVRNLRTLLFSHATFTN